MHRVLTTILLQDPLSLPLPRQQAVAEVLAAVAAPLQPAAGGNSNSTAAINWAAGGIPPNTATLGAQPSASLATIPLLPLLHLVSGSPSAGVIETLQPCRVSLLTRVIPHSQQQVMDERSNSPLNHLTCLQTFVRRHELWPCASWKPAALLTAWAALPARQCCGWTTCR